MGDAGKKNFNKGKYTYMSWDFHKIWTQISNTSSHVYQPERLDRKWLGIVWLKCLKCPPLGPPSP
jgi:hypothetical protein